MDGCYHALASLREQGVLKVIGVGVNEWQVCLKALKQRDFDAFLPAGRYTLLEQEALNDFLPPCEARGVAVLVGGGFNSGILATGTKPGAKYNCAPAPGRRDGKGCPERSRLRRAQPRNVEQLQQNFAWLSHPISTEFWPDLKSKGLLRDDAPVPA